MFLNFRDDIPVNIVSDSYAEIMCYSNGLNILSTIFVLCECHLILKNIDKEFQVASSPFLWLYIKCYFKHFVYNFST